MAGCRRGATPEEEALADTSSYFFLILATRALSALRKALPEAWNQ